MLDWLNRRFPATESASQLAQRFEAGLLAQRERADSQIFWLLIAQWAVILSTSIAMATRWQHARLDTLSAAVIWVGVLSVLPLAMVLRSPGSRWSRWTVVVSQGVMSALLWHISGGRPDTHLHLFAWLVVVALYRDVTALLATVAASLAGHALVLGLSTLPVLTTSDPALWFTHLVWLAWLFGEAAFLVAFVLLDRQTLAAQVDRAQALEILHSEFHAKVDRLTVKLAEERDVLRGEVASLTQRRASAEAARFEATRELLSLRRDIAAHGTEILKLASTPSDSSQTKEWRAHWKALRQQAQQLMRLVDMPSVDPLNESPETPSDSKLTHCEHLASPAGKRAMLMMRNPLQQAKAVAALETEGFKVDVVPNGPRAYYSVMLNDYSVIVVDIDLPGEEGFDTLEALRLLPPDRVSRSNCLFAVTTALKPERVLRCTGLNVDGMFVKPLTAEALHQTLSGAAASPGPSSGRPERDDSKTSWTDSTLQHAT